MAFYCPAADGLYLKASGDVVCWNSPGENSPLATVREDELDRFDVVHDVLHGKAMRAMRRDLIAHRNPFPFCSSCSWGCAQDDAQWRNVHLDTLTLKRLRVLQVEPSFLCNLDCPACFPFAQRREGKKAKILRPRVLEKVVDDLVRADLPVELVHLSGLGEPLMSPHFAELVRYLKRRLNAPVHCHTNANFEFREELLSCGLDSLTLAMDGAREQTYGEYRKRGRFDRALRFARDLCAAKTRTGMSGLNIAWKTVMFEWNSSDEQIREVLHLADSVGPDEIVLANSTTVGGISHGHDHSRWSEVCSLVKEELAPELATPVRFEDPECFGGQSYRTYGYLEEARVHGDVLRLRGWVLLDDGPPDEILVEGAEGTGAASLSWHERSDVARAHVGIKGAGRSGFSLELALGPETRQSLLRVKLMRRGVERARLSMEPPPRTGDTLLAHPVSIKHRQRVDWLAL